MSMLTPEESLRAWNRLKHGHGGPIYIGMCDDDQMTAAGGTVIHMAKGYVGVKKQALQLGMPELANIAERALSLIKHRVLIDRSEVSEFITRNLNQLQGTK